MGFFVYKTSIVKLQASYFFHEVINFSSQILIVSMINDILCGLWACILTLKTISLLYLHSNIGLKSCFIAIKRDYFPIINWLHYIKFLFFSLYVNVDDNMCVILTTLSRWLDLISSFEDKKKLRWRRNERW